MSEDTKSNPSSDAKRSAIANLKSQMSALGGDSLGNSLKASVVAKDEDGLIEGLKKAASIVEQREDDKEDDFSEMSKEDLIKLLQNK